MGVQARNPFENDDPIETDAVTTGAPAPVVTLAAIDHVAIAVPDLDEALVDHREAFGTTVEQREVLGEDGVEVAVLRIGDSSIQLLASTRDDSFVAEFLDAQGPGLHHVGYRVDDCRAAVTALAEQGFEFIDLEPRTWVGGAPAVFADPATMHGALVLLVEHQG